MPAADLARGTNPYKGPYAFTLKDAALFTGRDEEAETLLSLAISERVVVFCAPSGAGKSSLLNARLIPGLRRGGFKVLPVVRVGGDLPQGADPANVFTFNALWILAGAKADPAALKDCTLDAFLRPISRGRGRKGPPRVLVFDQFEEVLTTHTDRWPQRKEFFLQLRQALLDDPTLSVVMSLREDHLAGLDTYAPLLPGQLRTRFRMETLRRDKAVTAVRQPALAAGLPFDPEVAERLVEDLSRVRMAGHEEPVPGEFVEPVQLQVVCYQLWENLQEQSQEQSQDQPRKTITEQDRRRFGDPDQALEGFYESAVRKASAETGVSELQIRRWFGTALITPSRIRGQVGRETGTSGGLSNEAVDFLVDAHLVRAEAARGGIWYELAHDRFIDPILRSNARAEPAEAAPLTADAQAWRDAGRDRSFLYRGLRLEEAQRSAEAAGDLLTSLEREFLAESKKAEADAQVRRARRLWFAVAVLAVLVLAAMGSARVAWQQRRLALARELALSATNQAESDQELGLLLALEAVKRAPILETEAALHETLRISGVRWDHSMPVASGSSSAFAFSPDSRRCAVVNEAGAVAAWEMASPGRWIGSAPRPAATVTSLAYSPSGTVAYGDKDGRVSFWVPGSSSPPSPPLTLGAAIKSLAYSPDGSRLAVASDSPDARIWNTATEAFETLPGEPGTTLRNVAFSRDGRYLAMVPEPKNEEEAGWVIVQDLQSPDRFRLRHSSPVTSVAFGQGDILATGSQDTGLRVWSWRAGKVFWTLFGHRAQISDLAFSPDGEYVATASFDGQARVWNLGSGEPQYVLSPEGGQLSRVAFSPHAGKIATVSQATPNTGQWTGTLTLWDVALDKDLFLPVQAHHLTGFTPDSRNLIIVNPRGQVLSWDLSGQKLAPPLLGGVNIGRARLSAQGDLLALRGEELFSQRVPSGKTSLNRVGPDLGYSKFIVSPDGRLMAFANGNAVHLLKLGGDSRHPEGKGIALPEQKKTVGAMAFDPQATRLALTLDDGSIQLWSVLGNRLETSLPPAPGGASVHHIEISPDGRWLASAGDDRKVRLWDLEKWTLEQTFEGHTGRVVTVAFSPDSLRLASGDEEGQVRLWEIAEGRSIFDLPASTHPVTELAFSPDGKWLASATSDGTVRLEPMALDALIARARRRLSGRELTAQERRIYLHQD